MIQKPEFRYEINHDKKFFRSVEKINKLIDTLNKKNIPEDITARINDDLRDLADFQGLSKDLKKGSIGLTVKYFIW